MAQPNKKTKRSIYNRFKHDIDQYNAACLADSNFDTIESMTSSQAKEFTTWCIANNVNSNTEKGKRAINKYFDDFRRSQQKIDLVYIFSMGWRLVLLSLVLWFLVSVFLSWH